MIDSLHIQNYRLFKDLKIDKLGQVNLIAGKNNTGKTALLEALRIYLSKGELSVIANILFNRGSLIKNRDLEAIKSIFYENMGSIILNELTIQYDNDFFKTIIHNANDEILSNSKMFPLDNLDLYSKTENPNDKVIFIAFKDNLIYKDWEKFTTQQDDKLIEILNLIQPNIIDYRIVDNIPVLGTKTSELRQSIKLFGDGVSRVFSIGFSLIKSKDSILLIDEFEVGLHHSIQKQLWEIIFKYAKLWNIQVFITTHSHDTVKAFATVWNEKDNLEMGQYFRLTQDKTDPTVIYPEFYDNEELLSSIYNLEPR
jgi:AAA15 family ATPase/GTPase